MTGNRLLSLLNEVKFQTSRSSGPGGQNVNKVNTKVTLKFNVSESQILREAEKVLLSRKLSKKLSGDGTLVLHAQEKRSQVQNKELVKKKFLDLVKKALRKPKARKSTKPTGVSVEKRLKKKKEISEKKKWRGKID